MSYVPRIDELSLWYVDGALQTAGGALLVVAGLHLARQAAARQDILRTPCISSRSVDGLETCGVLLLYLTLVSLSAWAAQLPNEQSGTPGSQAWRLMSGLDAVARLIYAAVTIWLFSRRPCFAPGDVKPHRPRGGRILCGAALALAALPLTYSQLAAGKALWRWLDPDAAQPTHVALRAILAVESDGWALAQIAFAAVVVAPLAEELFFRGLLLQAIWRYTGLVWPAIIVSSLAFGWIHHSQPQDVPPLTTLGLLLAVARVRYRSLAVCVIAHALFNARTMAIALLNPELTEVW